MAYFNRLFSLPKFLKAADQSDRAFVAKRDFSQDERDKAAKAGAAMSDGSFPIYSSKDVEHAVELSGDSKHPLDEVKAHIKRRAKEIGAESALPDDWK